MQQHPEGIHEL